MSNSNERPSSTLAFVRPAKAGVFVVLLLAAAVAGGVYAWRSGWIAKRQGGDPSATPSPPAAKRSAPTPAPIQPAPRRPTSIFDDAADSAAAGAPTPARPSPATPTPPAHVDTAPRAAADVPPLAASPAVQDLPTLQSAARDAERALAQAREFGVAKLKASPQFADRQAEVDRLEAALRQARASGTPDQRNAASAAWNKARLALDAAYDAVLTADPAYAAAKANAADAVNALKAARVAKPRPQ